MVKKIFAIAVIFISIVTNSCLGEDKCTKSTEFMPKLCPIKFPKIKTIHIDENGARSPNFSPEINIDCSSAFKLTEKQVRQYFSLVMTTSRHEAVKVLDWLPCHVRGRLTFENGRTASWYINHGQAGTISENGWEENENGELIYLYCPKCKFKPFMDTSDEGIEDSSDDSE